MGDGNECNKRQTGFQCDNVPGTKQKRILDAKEKKIQAPVKLRVLSLNCHVYPVQIILELKICMNYSTSSTN